MRSCAFPRDRQMSGALEPRQLQNRQQRSDVQARGGWIEADVPGGRAGGKRVARAFRRIVEKPPPLEFRDQIHAARTISPRL
jgi:hypothetical protein